MPIVLPSFFVGGVSSSLQSLAVTLNRTRKTIGWLTIVVATIGVGVLPTRAAAATCGDYVIHVGDLRHAQSPDGSPARGDELTGESRQSTCHGPQCQRHAPVPPAPVFIPTFSPIDQACGMLGGDASPVAGSRFVVELFVEPRTGFRSTIDRPPRAQA